jgi:hypothetical protein
MADSLYLSLWFPDFDGEDMLPRALSVLRAVPFSAEQPGITYVSLHPVSWDEPTILEQRFNPGVTPEAAVLFASDLLHEDYGYVFEAAWDLWVASSDQRNWTLQPAPVKVIVHGTEFDEGAYREEGHIKVELGLDSTFLNEEIPLTIEAESHVQANIQRLVEFATKAEKNSGATGRLLWSELEENLAQKVIARLQRVQ